MARAGTATVVGLLVAVTLVGAPAAGQEGSCPSGIVALTFDDGPGRQTGPILDVLRDRQAPATFFVVGQMVARQPDLVARAAAEGHPIANHTWGHDRLTSLSDVAIRDTVNRTDAVIRAASASPLPLVRPPFGATGGRVIHALRAGGYAHVLWTLDPQDFRAISADTIASRVLAGLRDHAVVLLHDGVANSVATTAALPAIIDGARARGFCLGVLDAAGLVVPAGTSLAPEAVAPAQHVTVVAGRHRVETAVLLSAMAWPAGAPGAVLASAGRFADALSASSLAGAVGGPLLLSDEAALSAEAVAELARLAPSRVHVLGPLSDEVVAAVEALGAEVVRLRGADRYATAELVADETVRLGGDPSAVFVTTGEDFPDALGASALAAALRHPVLLVHPRHGGGRIGATMAHLGAVRTYVVGGPAAVPDEVVAGLPGVVRLAGPSRAGTASAVAAWGLQLGLVGDPLVASGDRFPDGLAGGVAAAALGRPLLITSGNALSPEVHAWLAAHGTGAVTVLGGPASVSPLGLCQLATGMRDHRACPSSG